MENKIVEKLFDKMRQSKGFPALESTVADLLERLRVNPDESKTLVDPITSDFALTQQVLLLANSAMYAPFAKNVPSISKALQILGSDALRNIILSVPTVESFHDLTERELAKITVSSELARTVAPSNSEAASIASVFYNLGTLVAAKYLPDELEHILKLSYDDEHTEKAAKEVLGMTLPELGALVAKQWKLPGSIVSIIDGTGDERLLKVAKFSNTVATLIYENRQSEISKCITEYQIPDDVVSNLESRVTELLASQNKVRESEPRTSVSDLEELLWKVKTEQHSTIDGLASAIFPSLHNILGTEHCLLASNLGGNYFRVSCAHGNSLGSLIRAFKAHEDSEKTALGIVIGRNVDLYLSDVSLLKPGVLPNWYKEVFPELRAILVMPIFNCGVAGMLVYDWSKLVKITNAELYVLRRLRNLFVKFYPPQST